MKNLKRWVSGVTVAGMMFSMLAPMAAADGGAVQVSAVDSAKVPKLLITELVPDTANVDGADAYEFIEVYNNSNVTLDFNQYNLVYRYSGADTVWAPFQNGNPGGSMPIPAQSSIVLWVMNAKNKGLTAANFNANFQTNLQENVNLYRVEGGGGMHNSNPRDLVIQEKTSSDISIASYQNDEQTKPEKGIFYRYPGDGSKNMVMYGSGADTNAAIATPGTIDPSQVPSVPRMFSEAPAISHAPVTQADQKNDLVLQAQIANAEQGETVAAAVYYQMASQTSYESLPMTVTGSSQYQAVIPRAMLTESQMKYYVQADDGFSTVRSSVYSVAVAMDQTDYSKVPPLMVTEVVPDSTNVGSADGYEFIEVYNNTDQTINFKDYKVVYRYTDSGPDADVPWPADKEDMLIPSKGTLVFWIINSQNGNSTVADFNANYGTNLVEGTDIVRIHSDGMANGSNRGLLVATNTGIELSASYYVNGDSKANKGIVYKFPSSGSTMIKASAGTVAATPGTVTQDQVPPQTVKVTPDTVKPALTDLTKESATDQSKDLEIIGEAKDETSLKTVALFYKTEKQSQYSKKYLKESFADTLYHYMIYSPELIGNAYLDYYFTASDGTNETVSQVKRVQILGGSDHSSLRLNVKDGDVISQTKVLKGTGEGLNPDDLKLAIDGTELTQSTYHAVEHDAFFAFEVMGVNYYFKNGVTQGQEILSIFQDPINSYKTLSVPITADRLKEGGNAFQIRAGSKSSPFDDRVEENKDNFEVKNVRLVFADGTVVYDAKYNDPAKVIKIGDSSGQNPVLDLNFVIPSSQLASKAYDWNTASVSDGNHQITVSHNGDGAVTSNVTVDNTAPVVQPSVEEGKLYRGSFTIDASVTDALAGVDKVEATLDEQPITLPMAASSAQLPGGAHVFSVKATDKVGNVNEVSVHFEVPNETPDLPVLVAPDQGAAGVGSNAALSVKVSDPMNDDLKVTFNQGFKYDAGTQGAFSGYRGASDTEPPKQEVPAGEKAFTSEDYGKVSSVDGSYLVDDAVEQFPYQRFEIALDPAVQSTDQVVIDWKGKSLEGRKVSLYAWSPSKMEWHALQTVIAGNEDFELKASVLAGDYANNGKIQVMVQDEIAVAQDQAADDGAYDFSFVWMSDTQYYSKSYPYIYQKIVKWIADHKEDNKIKYVIHTGDIVDNADQEYQWVEADKDMKVLEAAGIPYGVLAGNHDVGHQDNDYSYYSKWFGEDRFKNQPTYGESYDNNRGHYDLVSSNGNDFIIIYMGWGYGDKEIDWIDSVLKKYPNRKAILNFHEFMLVSNNRAPMAEKVFERVIKPNKNVIAALSGHYHDAELKVDAIDDNGDGVADRNVYQMLADYQGAPEGGLGYIRLMQFDLDAGKINMKTYSPHLDDYNYYEPDVDPGKDEFSLDLNLQPVVKRVATDYIGVNVYTSKKIGSVEGVKSGENATVTWPNLAQNTSYQWYAVAEDAYGGLRQSDIWRFTTKGATDSNESNGGSSGGGGGGAGVPANPTEGTVPAGGGTVVLEGATVTIPSGAIPSDVKVKVVKLSEGASLPVEASAQLLGDVYEITKDQDGAFTKAIQITLPFDSSKVDLSKLQLGLYWFNETTRTWVPLDNIKVDAEKGTVTGSVTHFTKFAVIANPKEGTQPAPGTADFADIKGHWAEKDIRELVGQGSIDGYPDGTFRPDNRITRAEFVSMVVKVLGLSVQGGKPFSDTSSHWAKDIIAAAAAQGIVTGYSDTTFGPDDEITREQMAEIIVRAAHLEKATAGTSFADQAQISEWAQGAVAALTAEGYLNGYEDGTFRPQGLTTRAEATAMILRALK